MSNQKYKRLNSSSEGDNESKRSSVHSLEESALDMPSNEGQLNRGLSAEHFESSRPSIENLFPSTSNLESIHASNSMNTSAQFEQAMRYVDSSQSSSWFTASSITGECELMTKSVELTGTTERTPFITASLEETETDQSQSNIFCRRSFAATRHPQSISDLSFGIGSNGYPRRKLLKMYSGESSSSSHEAKSVRTSFGSTHVTRHTSIVNSESVRNLVLSTRASSFHSPSKILRLKWKSLFTPRRSTVSNENEKRTRHLPGSFPAEQSMQWYSTGQDSVEPPIQHIHSPSSSKLASHTLHDPLSLKMEPRRLSEVTRDMQMDEKSEELKCLSRVRSSLPVLESLRHFHYEIPSIGGEKRNVPENIPPGTKSTDLTTEEQLVVQSVPDQFKSSFEREDEPTDNLIEREAHIGALALAWARETRKPRRKADPMSTEQKATLNLEQGGTLRTVKTDVRPFADEYTGNISSQILSKSSWRNYHGRSRYNKSDGEDLGIEFPRPASSAILSAIISSPMRTAFAPLNLRQQDLKLLNLSQPTSSAGIIQTGEHPRSISPITPQVVKRGTSANNRSTLRNSFRFLRSRLFGIKPKQSSVKLFEQSVRNKLSDTSESQPSSLDENVKPIGHRSKIRRGAQDIPPVCATGGPLTSAQQTLLQKTQTHSIGWRLSRRKALNERRRKIADYSFLFALIGIILMVLELEMLMAGVYSRTSFYSMLMKSLITASSLILVGLIVCYHAVDIQLFSVNNCIEDWRIATNYRRLGMVMLEVLLCLVHPPPIISNFQWSLSNFAIRAHTRTVNSEENPPNMIRPVHTYSPATTVEFSSISFDALTEPKSEFVSLELTLAIPMFLRLYMIFRVLLLHSTFFTDAGSRSIGALNRVKINVRFVLKTLATAQPGTMLLIFILLMWVITSWIMRVCERQQNPEYEKMLNTMWLIAVTFLSIGYGDMVPNTHCGRSISVIAGVMGSACTALVVAVVARKLELSRAEKHVHNFMQDNKVYKQLRHSAANVLRETWLFYKHTRLVKRVNASRVRHHQRKFLTAISRLRKAKDDQRKLKEDANSMVDLAKLQTCIHDIVSNIRTDQAVFVQRLISVERTLGQLQSQITQLSGSFTQFVKSNGISSGDCEKSNVSQQNQEESPLVAQ